MKTMLFWIIFLLRIQVYEGQDKYMLDKVTSLLKDPSIVEITRAGSIVASHCGPGTIGLLYIKKR